jgi:hypothetical protein
MSSRGSASTAEPYSPNRRTALVLSGVGTAGAYHAGVLRALHEAGVKVDVVGGRGIGCVGALFAAVDGAQRLWDERGFWRAPAARRLYAWRPALQIVAVAVLSALALIAIPILAVAAGLVVFPIDFLLKMVGVSAASGLVARYLTFANAAFAPGALPTWLPRLALLALAAGAAAAIASAWTAGDTRRRRGAVWWRVVQAPLDCSAAVGCTWSAMWDLLRGAAQLRQPSPIELGRRYLELLADNLGQPGFRELIFTVHDLDAHRDLVFAVVAESRRRDLLRRATTQEAEARRAELIDLSGIGRDHLADGVAAALALPLATEPHTITFSADAYWRGEAHRLCDRPGSLARLIQELAALDVEQIIIVTAAPDASSPHALAPPRIEGRARLGEYLQSAEAAAVRDIVAATSLPAAGRPRLFTIRPAHNPVGPLDFRGGYDDRSDRRQPLAELMGRGYEDAYHQFIEPVVGASGDRVGQRAR